MGYWAIDRVLDGIKGRGTEVLQIGSRVLADSLKHEPIQAAFWVPFL